MSHNLHAGHSAGFYLVRSRAFYVLGIAVLAGVALQLGQAQLWPLEVYGAGLALVLGAALLCSWAWQGRWTAPRPAFVERIPRPARQLVAPLVLGLSGILLGLILGYAYAGWRAWGMQAQQLSPALDGQVLRLTGRVQDMVQATEWGQRFRLAVQDPPPGVPPLLMVSWNGGVEAGQTRMQAPQPVEVQSPSGDQEAPPTESDNTASDNMPTWQLSQGPPVLLPGDVWQLSLRLKPVHGQHNPGGFDSELWAWEQSLGGTASVRARAGDTPPKRLSRGWARPIERLRQTLRDRLLAYLDAPVPGRNASPQGLWAGVLAALLVGDQNAIHRAQWDVFRATGVAHLVSISGLHITLFAWLAGWLISRLWRMSPRLCLLVPAPRVAPLGGCVCAALYALLSGWGLPAQRTIWMLVAAVWLRQSGRRWPWPRVWLMVMLIVVAGDPWALLSAGFWLSFVAVAVLIASSTGPAGPPEAPAPEGQVLGTMSYRMWRSFVQQSRSALREQGLITLALAPLTLLLFQQQSLVGLLANLLAVPWVTLVVTPLTMLGVLHPYAWDLAYLAVQGLGACLQAMAQWPYAVLTVAAAPLWLSVMGVLGACILVLPLPLALRALGLPSVLMVLLWQAPRPAQGEFEVVFSDIGQGNAVLVRTHHHTLVYDSGPRYSSESDAGHRVLLPTLRHTAETPDLLLVSHQDNDHSGGAESLLAAFPEMDYLSSLPPEHQAAQRKTPRRCYSAQEGGQAWEWEGVQFQVLHPQLQDYEQARVRANALSCVLHISNGRQTVLLAGDLEAAQEERLVAQQAERLPADVLLVPHHGSKTSSSGVFLDAVHPRIAIVQAAYRNRYGHPAPRIMQRYEIRGIKVLDSPHCGAALWQSVQAAQGQCSRHIAPRYWQHRVP